MKVFLSHPMTELSEPAIIKVRTTALEHLKKMYGDDVTIIDNYNHTNAPDNAGRVWHLGTSIAMMEEADLIYFCGGWESTKGCLIEHSICKMYNLHHLCEGEPINPSTLPNYTIPEINLGVFRCGEDEIPSDQIDKLFDFSEFKPVAAFGDIRIVRFAEESVRLVYGDDDDEYDDVKYTRYAILVPDPWGTKDIMHIEYHGLVKPLMDKYNLNLGAVIYPEVHMDGTYHIPYKIYSHCSSITSTVSSLPHGNSYDVTTGNITPLYRYRYLKRVIEIMVEDNMRDLLRYIRK